MYFLVLLICLTLSETHVEVPRKKTTMIFFVGLLTYMALTSDVSAASSVNEVCLGGQDCGKNQVQYSIRHIFTLFTC